MASEKKAQYVKAPLYEIGVGNTKSISQRRNLLLLLFMCNSKTDEMIPLQPLNACKNVAVF